MEQKILSYIQTAFTQMPFNRLLGLQILEYDRDKVLIELAWHENLMGNQLQKILHGGVISSVLDVAGGMMAIASMVDRTDINDMDRFISQLGTVGTINLRTDFLRPGRGELFRATAQLIRSGNKVCVCTMALHNEQDQQIATGTGNYLVG